MATYTEPTIKCPASLGKSENCCFHSVSLFAKDSYAGILRCCRCNRAARQVRKAKAWPPG